MLKVAISAGGAALKLLAPAILLAGCGAQPARAPDPFTQTGELIAFGGGDAGPSAACVTCHGLDGTGDGELAPRLAGLPVGYLQKQLEDYAAEVRPHEQMARIAKALSQEDRAAVARYYAAAPWTSATAPAAPHPAGARLYQAGDPSRGLAACAQCHGAAGQGTGAANPPLAGQPPGYLAEQLRLWKKGERRNDPGAVMLRISRRLSDREIDDLSRYAASLSPPPAPPAAPPEPSPRTHRPDR